MDKEREARLQQYVGFIEECEGLKSVLRTAWASSGRQESTAEHSWRLALLALLISDEFPGLNKEKLLTMCLIHDIAEIYTGDISAALRPDQDEKLAGEAEGALKIFSLLPEKQASRMMDIWREYNDNQTPEANLIKALDKAETIIQHSQGWNPGSVDYCFNLGYGRQYFNNEFLESLRKILDEKTSRRAMDCE